ncbi:MAG TPA: hypothetical protein VF163_16255 [Micromonosporaceae bacterium]
MASDPLVPKILQRLRRADALAARRAERALDELLTEGGLAELTQHDLQTFLWFNLIDADDAQAIAAALARFFELAELNRYAGIAASDQTREILRAYEERGHQAGMKAAAKAMDASGILPPDLPELEWGEVMGASEVNAYERIAATLELALAAGELKPGGRGWRLTQQRLTRQQLTMPRMDGPPLLERIRAERLDSWADLGGAGRRMLAASMLPDLVSDPAPPRDVAERMAAMQWLLELAAGQAADPPGVPLTVSGNLARRVVQDAAERFGWWDLPERPPRSESDIWRLAELRLLLQSAGVLRRSGRRLILGTRGRALIGDAKAQWDLATTTLLEPTGFDAAVQEAALMLLLRANGMVEVRELIGEVVEVIVGSGWRDTGNGAPPDERDVGRAVWGLVRRCELWSMVDEGRGPGFTSRLRLSDAGRRGGYAALRAVALRPRMDDDA